MKLHKQTVDKLMNIFENYGGHSSNTKLRKIIEEMDFTEYTQKTSGNTVLVETQEYVKAEQKLKGNRI